MNPQEWLSRKLHRDKQVVPETQEEIDVRIKALGEVLGQFSDIFFYLYIHPEGASGYRGTWDRGSLTGSVTLSLNPENKKLIDVFIVTTFGREVSLQIDTKGETPLTRIGQGWTRRLLNELGYVLV